MGRSGRAWRDGHISKSRYGAPDYVAETMHGLAVRFTFGEAFERAVDEGAEVPAVDVFVGGFSGGVVAAGEDPGDVVDVESVEVFEDVEGVLEGEGEVVGGVDDEGALGSCSEAVHVGHRADDGEDLTDLILRQAGPFEGSAGVSA